MINMIHDKLNLCDTRLIWSLAGCYRPGTCLCCHRGCIPPLSSVPGTECTKYCAAPCCLSPLETEKTQKLQNVYGQIKLFFLFSNGTCNSLCCKSVTKYKYVANSTFALSINALIYPGNITFRTCTTVTGFTPIFTVSPVCYWALTLAAWGVHDEWTVLGFTPLALFLRHRAKRLFRLPLSPLGREPLHLNTQDGRSTY